MEQEWDWGNYQLSENETRFFSIELRSIMCSYMIRHTNIHTVVIGLLSGESGGYSSTFPLLTDDIFTKWTNRQNCYSEFWKKNAVNFINNLQALTGNNTISPIFEADPNGKTTYLLISPYFRPYDSS